MLLTANVTVNGNSNLTPQGRAGSEILQVAGQNLVIDVGKIRMRLNNLFNGDRVLGQWLRSFSPLFIWRLTQTIALFGSVTGETVNNFLNENSQDVFAQVKPEMAKQVSGLVTKVMNDALGGLPTEKFFRRS